jgi:hypothetical protein
VHSNLGEGEEWGEGEGGGGRQNRQRRQVSTKNVGSSKQVHVAPLEGHVVHRNLGGGWGGGETKYFLGT